MAEAAPLTFLCITTYEKGQEFMRECKRQGCRVFLLTAETLAECRLAAREPRRSLLYAGRSARARGRESRNLPGA